MKDTYTTIVHKYRDALGLTNNEYILLDCINKLSTNPKSKLAGWCYSTQNSLASYVGISRPSLNSMITRLETRDLLIRKKTKKENNIITIYKTSQKWFDVVIKGCNETLQGCNETLQGGVMKPYKGCNETLHINNNIDNNKNINTMSDSKNPTAFDEFWDKFNHKVGSKKTCRTYFNRLSRANQDHAIKIIPSYHEWLQVTGTSIKQPLGWLKKYLDTDFKALISQERSKTGNNTHQVDLVALRAKLMSLRSKHADVWTKEYDTKIKDSGILKGYRFIERKHPEWIS